MKKFFTLITTFFLVASVYSQNPGSKSLVHTHTGRTFEQGRLEIHTDLSFYTKLGEFIGSAPDDFAAANYWNVSSNIQINYGLVDHLDIMAGLRLYQDTQAEKADLPVSRP